MFLAGIYNFQDLLFCEAGKDYGLHFSDTKKSFKTTKRENILLMLQRVSKLLSASERMMMQIEAQCHQF